jgi:hypothetical protein
MALGSKKRRLANNKSEKHSKVKYTELQIV